ncbi:TonB-dependent receptor [Lunatimonas lonarensis]|uniref:TonB-dependent receptor n=1 Tax=Lunatimonas lonarensis TaxID=1232681 RepID=R7ZPL2_9BACT|nr:TonB-dependent receptor [Lunatimonas lonarensis]EON75964.1 TonB-dependent receptor [Lunatimonas lonarensis]
MRLYYAYFLAVSFCLFGFGKINAQETTYISGQVFDKVTSEPLPGANVYWTMAVSRGVVSDLEGGFSLPVMSLPAELVVSFIGFEPVKRVLTDKDLNRELKLFLSPDEVSLQEVVVRELRENNNVVGVDMGKTSLPVSLIKSIPALFGEVDLLRSLQFLPGVNTAGEGTTGLFVRGGSADQNLVQIDGAPIYNPSHFFGFFSVFNPDALADVSLSKGHIPSRYGGRLSSLIDVSLKEGNTQRIRGEGGIGSISSRLTVDGPLFSENSSFVLSGRRTYADLFLKLSPNENVRNNQLYFYDTSGKFMWRLKDRDKITLSSYYGADFLGAGGQFGLGWANWISSLNWTRTLKENLFLDVNGYHSYYNYEIAFTNPDIGFDWTNNLAESGIRGEVHYVPEQGKDLYVGVHSQVYHFSPVQLIPRPESVIDPLTTNSKTAWQNNLFVNWSQDLGANLFFEGGIRWSHYQQIGPATEYVYENQDPTSGAVIDTLTYKSLQHVKTYQGLEPRLAIRYLLNESLSLKGSYNRNFQYVQIATNNSAGLPIDRWTPAGPYIAPVRSDQVSIGAFKNLDNNRFELSVEGYYKDFDQVIDLKQGANILFSDNLETEVLAGRGWSYGVEFLLRKNVGKSTGWLSYTWSRVYRQIDGINEDRPFNPRFDRPHDVSLIVNHRLTPRLELSGTFVYSSGVAVTFPVGSYVIDNQRVPLYSPRRNEDRFPAFHRMDLSANLKNRDKGRWWKGSWNFSVYNAYNRKNPFSYQFTDIYNNDITFNPGPGREVTSVRPGVVMTYLFGVLPSITYNFEF